MSLARFPRTALVLGAAAATVGAVALWIGTRSAAPREISGSAPQELGPPHGLKFVTPEVEPKPVPYGLELSSTTDEIIIGLDFNLPERRLMARRPKPRAAYSVTVTDASGRTLERCTGGLVFEHAIHDLSHVRAKSALEPKLGARVFANHARRVAEFTVVNNTQVDGVTYRGVVADSAPRSVTVVKYDRYFYDTLLSAELFDKLALGCSALSRDD